VLCATASNIAMCYWISERIHHATRRMLCGDAICDFGCCSEVVNNSQTAVRLFQSVTIITNDSKTLLTAFVNTVHRVKKFPACSSGVLVASLV